VAEGPPLWASESYLTSFSHNSLTVHLPCPQGAQSGALGYRWTLLWHPEQEREHTPV
jgi:hypothetical protein